MTDLRSELEWVVARAYGNTNIIGFRSEKVAAAILDRFLVSLPPDGVEPGAVEIEREPSSIPHCANPACCDERIPLYRLRPLSDTTASSDGA